VLIELRIRDLGVIQDVSLVLGSGMTALTGETGAGKTMLVEAIELLVGGRADAAVVRTGADEAVIEGRFVTVDASGEEHEVVLGRTVPRVGRSRAYVDGRLAPASALAELGGTLVDLHGQHAHQSLLAPATQRAALDRFAGIDLGLLRAAKDEISAIDAALASLGGDERARARELDLLRFQVGELEAAAIEDAAEDQRLDVEESLLGDAVAHQGAALAALATLADDGGVLDLLGAATGLLAGRAPLAPIEERLRTVAADLADAVGELRSTAEGIEDDPERLDVIRQRRQLLHELRRKYGDTLEEVVAFAGEARERLDELLDHDRRAAALDAERAVAVGRYAEAARVVAAARRHAAPALAAAAEQHLGDLAMARARLAVEVTGDDPGDGVGFLLAANAGAEPAPLAKVASGGELARTMLAVRLVLAGTDDGTGPPTLVFDEVDAGIGGTAALAVGRALAALAGDRQVLVVTHLPQVAACADTQVVVAKADDGHVTTARAAVVRGEERVVELSRMLSGTPESAATREAAAELLATARGGS
jgi:DNA repair protein RecN (Recombination protein N)